MLDKEPVDKEKVEKDFVEESTNAYYSSRGPGSGFGGGRQGFAHEDYAMYEIVMEFKREPGSMPETAVFHGDEPKGADDTHKSIIYIDLENLELDVEGRFSTAYTTANTEPEDNLYIDFHSARIIKYRPIKIETVSWAEEREATLREKIAHLSRTVPDESKIKGDYRLEVGEWAYLSDQY